MLQLVKLGNRVHLFDSERKMFVKQTYANVSRSVFGREPTSRKKMLKYADWVRCMDPTCRLISCRQKRDHWLANTYWT